MKLNELKSLATLPSTPRWKIQLEKFLKESSPEQLLGLKVAVKMGDINDAKKIVESWQSDLLEKKKRKKKKKSSKKRRPFQYGVYGGWFYPGFHNNSGVDTSPEADGAADGGGESVQENRESDSDIVQRFARNCAEYLGLRNPPEIKLRRDPEWTRRRGTFGRYTADPHNRIELATSGRHIIDILRTLAHEMTHAAQNEKIGLPDHAGETGSEFEDGANAMAGRIMRHWAENEPELFAGVELDEDWKKAVGSAAAAACVAGTPGCATTGTTAADALRTIQTIGRTAQNLPTRAGAEEELRQAIKDRLRRAQGIQEASGYIPTEAERNDPRFSMALTQDIRPGETGKEANKLGLQTDSQGRPALLMKKLNNLLEAVKLDEKCWDGYRQAGMKKKGSRMVPNCVPLEEDQELTEVDMSPGALQKWARSDAAQRIRVGFEFEMYFPDTVDADRDDDYGGDDMEMDEEANSIRNIIEFFGGGNNPTPRGVLNRVEEGLYETFAEWRQSVIEYEASESGFYDYMEENEPDLREDKLEEYRQEARTELGDEASDNDIDERAQDLYVEWINDQYSSGGRYYDNYMEWLSDSLGDSYDESDWLRSEMRYMSDVAQEEDLEWPWINERGGGSGRTADDWAEELEGVVGMPVRTGRYQRSSRGEDNANLETDGSLNEPDSDADAGLEFITPYRPLPEAMQILNNVIEWADRNGIYTNSTTGLHMNVSIEGVKNVDWVKLVLFLGDRYILDQFDRRFAFYARSSLDKIEDKVRDAQPVQEQDDDQAIYSGKIDIEKALQMMRNNSIELARRAIQSGGGREKYQSVHVKELRDGSYIEFRGPGNDWLQKAQETERGLADTVYRLGRAMTIAADPEAERKEYARKLYKILTPEDPNKQTSMKLFADYSAGTISPEELKRAWAEQVLRAQRRGRDRDAQAEYDIVDRDTGEVIDTFSAAGDHDAVEVAQNRWSGRGINYDVRLHDREAALSPKERRRSELAQRVAGKPIWWRVSDKGGNYTGHVQAPTASKAIDNFMQQEPAAMRINRDRFEARPEDPPTATQSSNDPSSAVDLNALPPGESDFMVSWDEFRTHEGREVRVSDALRTTARNAAEAARRVHDSLQMQGREAFNVNAEPTDPPPWRRNRDMPAAATDNITNPLHQTTDDTAERREYHIFYRDTNRPVVAFMAASDEEALVRLDRFRREYPNSGDVGVRTGEITTRTSAQPQGEWTGRWLVQSTVTGETVHTISGIGNVQADANRHAARWVRSTGFDDPIEVVPEMQ